MKNLRFGLASKVVWIGLIALPAFGNDGFLRGIEKPKAVMVVLDISGSMSGRPLAEVKRVIEQTFTSEEGSNLAGGLVSFSGCGPSTVRLEVPIDRKNGKAVIAAANRLMAHGGTDIGLALTIAQGEVERVKDKYCVQTLLLTDGVDTCGHAMPRLKGPGGKNNTEECDNFDVISIGVPDWQAKLFDKLVKNGKHVAIKDETSIEKAIQEVLEAFSDSEKTKVKNQSGDYSGGAGPSNPEKKKEDGKEEKKKETSPPASTATSGAEKEKAKKK